MNDEYNQKIVRLQSLIIVQSAEISSLLNILLALVESLEIDRKGDESVAAKFADGRKKLVQAQLLHLEKTKPELAAAIQSVLDSSCTHLPFDYND